MTSAVAARRTGASRDAVSRFREFVVQTAFTRKDVALTEQIGAEIEFLALAEGGRVAPLEAVGGPSVLRAVRAAGRSRGWCEGQSDKGAPWFTLPSGGRVTFEPGGQVEYASPPWRSATALLEDLETTAATLREGCERHGIRLLDCGLDPINGPDNAPLQVPAARYRRMGAHFDRIGPAGVRMMRQTASLHIAVDIGAAIARRWRILNALAPVLTAIFANSRHYAGARTQYVSYRAETWRRADPLRTGVFEGIDPVGEYVEFALGAPAIFLGDERDPARPFESWLSVADEGQYEKHLGSLFPDVRPRGYFEARSVDAIPQRLWPAAVALIAGVVYDGQASCEAAEILGSPDPARLALAGLLGLSDPSLRRFARELTGVALDGCRRLGPAFLSGTQLDAAADGLRALTR